MSESNRQPPDPLQLVLQAVWSQEKPTRHKPLQADIKKRIEKFAGRWQSPITLQPAQAEAIRELLRRGPRRVTEAKHAGFGMSLLVLWWCSADRDFDLRRMLSPVSLSAFADNLTLEGYSQGTLNAYIPSLDRLGRILNPSQTKEWKALNRTPTAKKDYASPCGEDVAWALFSLAWAQPTARLRDGLLGLLYLTLGVGLYERALSLIRGNDIRQAADGAVLVRVDDHWLTVRPRYAPGLLALADRVGKGQLVLGGRSKNKTTPLLEDLVIPAGAPIPKIPELVANYRWWVDEQFEIAGLVDQCGANALVHLAQLHRRSPRRPSSRSASLLAPSGDADDGPWAPDWPARHHRS